MSLANGAVPRAISSRLAPIVIGAVLLAGCQSAGQAPPAEVRADAWRVIERVGEARYLAPGASSWAAALSATTLPDGSKVATGMGGRLILARAADHLSAGPGSQFSLPDAAPDTVLEQTAGRVRYRLTESSPFRVATPALAIRVGGSVFDVTVGADASEVAVERGRLRVATPDGEREIELEAGQSARAGGPQALAFRRASGQPLEPVERLTLPALQPKPAVAGPLRPESSLPAALAAPDQASTSAAAFVESAVPIAIAGPTGPVEPMPQAPPPVAIEAPLELEDEIALPPAAVEVEPTTPPAPGVGAAAQSSSTRAPDAPPTVGVTGEDRRLLFDRLTEGMIDAAPARPALHERAARARSS